MASKNASGIDIFVVDDEYVIAHTLGLILSQVGYSVRVFDNSRTARTNLHDSPQLLISDYQMPWLTGSDLACIVAEEVPSTQVLLFSANLLPTDPAWLIVESKFSSARLVAKPLSPVHLLKHVEEMIGRPSHEKFYPLLPARTARHGLFAKEADALG